MIHAVLLGDSIFDNAVYVEPGEPDVVKQVRKRLGSGSAATLLAVDGAVTSDVPGQLSGLPSDATHVFVSCGGNDALQGLGLLDRPATSSRETLATFAAAAKSFRADYRHTLERLRETHLPTTVCTVYNPRFDTEDASRLPDFGLSALDPGGRSELQRLAVTALAFFNDVIIHEAVLAGLSLLDLRILCNEDADFANPIEPSARGGDKIASAIVGIVGGHDSVVRSVQIFVTRHSDS